MDQLSIEGLTAIADSDPASLDLALLDPLREQLKALCEQYEQDGGDPNSPEYQQIEALKAAVGSLVDEQIARLNTLCMKQTDEWQKAVKQRTPIDDRWIDDERQFNGRPVVRDSKVYASDAADPRKGTNEPIVANATRSRTLMCWGRLCDMMLPANDFPMRVDPPDTPDPAQYPTALAKAMQAEMKKAQAQPADPNAPPPPQPDPMQVLERVAGEQAGEMQSEIFQMLRDAKFQVHARKALFDTARLGCGILKGPFPSLSQTRTFTPDGSSFDIKESASAGIAYVNPRFFWYDMAPSLDRASRTYEVELINKRELGDMKRYPRTITSTIDELLKIDEPKLEGDFRAAMNRWNDLTDLKDPLDNVYARLEVHEVITAEELEKLTGIKWDHEEMPVLHTWSINGKCVKFKLTPLERDFRLDYYNFTIMPADDTIYGYGYPYLARSAQRFTDGAMNATMVNAAASAAPMLLVAQGKVHPNRENWKFRGMNIFSVENQSEPLTNFFASVMVESNVEQNLKLLQVAEDMMNKDTLYGEILQGDANGEEMPASGMVMSANLQNVFQKSIAAYGDDNVFLPLCERLIWWRKMYGDAMGKPPIEGDMVPKAIASTQLVSKDLALQHTQAAINLAQIPMFAGFADPYALFSAMMHNIDGIPNKDQIVLPRDEAMANQAAIQQAQQQGDPAKAAEIAAQVQINREKLASAERVAAADQQTRLLEMRGRVEVARMTVQAQLIELQQKQQIDLAKVGADSAAAAQDDATRRFEATLDAAITTRIENNKLFAHSLGEPSPYSAKD